MPPATTTTASTDDDDDDACATHLARHPEAPPRVPNPTELFAVAALRPGTAPTGARDNNSAAGRVIAIPAGILGRSKSSARVLHRAVYRRPRSMRRDVPRMPTVG
jgi:hypothetical protein